jgi:hypothetical protein
MSGLSRTPGKRVWDNIPTGVRIPPSPPEASQLQTSQNQNRQAVSALFCFIPEPQDLVQNGLFSPTFGHGLVTNLIG